MTKIKTLIALLFIVCSCTFAQVKSGSKQAPKKETAQAKTFKGKLLLEFYDQVAPLRNATVSLTSDGKLDTNCIARTDKYGDFEIVSSNSKNLNILVLPETKEVTNIVLATQQGVEITRLKRGPNGFVYKLIAPDIIKLTEMEVDEDITIVFDKFKKTSNTSLHVIENINYRTDEYKPDKAAQLILGKVVTIMKENPELKLEIISHTDSKGDDKFNMTLSQKRSQFASEYLVTNGVAKERISTQGKGETKIRNRCNNGVDCSEKEHAYNRRTEFNFTK